jgi:hypothetical protein
VDLAVKSGKRVQQDRLAIFDETIPIEAATGTCADTSQSFSM